MDGEDAAPRGDARDGVRGACATLLGTSPAIEELREHVRRLAPTTVAVLVQGETGTGKELVARAVHAASPRARGAFVPVNCGALAPELVDAELFGHERGAFTGAQARRPGRAAEAHGGTLFLDEIGELPPPSQCKLLRLLQEGELQRVGADRPVVADVRVVAATNRDLRALVSRGVFRADCYYRIAGFTLHVPPLRDREDDVLLIADHLRERFATELGRPTPALAAGARAALRGHRWPGNVRELENVMRACVLYAEDSVITAAQLRATLGSDTTAAAAAPVDLEALLRRCAGNVTRAARALGVSRPTLYKRMRARGVDGAAYRAGR